MARLAIDVVSADPEMADFIYEHRKQEFAELLATKDVDKIVVALQAGGYSKPQPVQKAMEAAKILLEKMRVIGELPESSRKKGIKPKAVIKSLEQQVKKSQQATEKAKQGEKPMGKVRSWFTRPKPTKDDRPAPARKKGLPSFTHGLN